jgi:hypothetical protein
MYRNNQCELGYAMRRLARAEMVEWLPTLGFEYFVSFATNREMTINGVHSKVRAWLARVDRYLLGRNWAKAPRDDRTLLVGYIEKPDLNIHMHAMVRLAVSDKILPVWRATEYWLDLVKSGDFDMQCINDQTAVAHYITKVVTNPVLYESFYIS